jgi:predicted nucleic acid-binding Zn ribbon protein
MAFVSLKSTLGRILRHHNIRDLEEVKIFSVWHDIAGERMAAHTRPTNISNRILYVEVDDPLWLSQLKYMKQEIVDKINIKIKTDLFKDVRFFLKNTS